MFLDNPAAKILTGIALGGVFGLLAFETVRLAPTGPAPAAYADGASPADLPAAEPVSAAFAPPALEALPPPPLAAPRRKPTVLAQRATFACGARPGAPKVTVGWAMSLFGKNPAARTTSPGPTAAAYATSLTWGGEGMSLAVHCSPGTAAKPAEHVALAPATAPRPLAALDYPAASPPLGLQMSALFKPVTDVMP